MSSFERVGAHTLRVEFADGCQQIIDFTPVLVGEMYGPLQNPDLFGQVQVDAEVHTLVWPNGADFDPATLMALSWKNSQPARNWASTPPPRSDPSPGGRRRGWFQSGDSNSFRQHIPRPGEPLERRRGGHVRSMTQILAAAALS